MKHVIKTILAIFIIITMSINLSIAIEKIELLGIKTKLVSGGQTQIMLSFSGQPMLPTEFAMYNPNKMIFDFTSVDNKIPKSSSAQSLTSSVVQGINFVEAEHKTRMIIDVANVVPFTTEIYNNNIIINLIDNANKTSNLTNNTQHNHHVQEKTFAAPENYDIKAIDFRRGEDGEGKLIIELASETASIDFREIDNEMVLEYKGATIPDKLLRRFDVSDFGTPIKYIVVLRKKDAVQFKIQAIGEYDKIAYQLAKQYIIEARPTTAQEKEIIKSQKFKFTGEKISLNFQDIEVRAVLQLMADFTGLNIIASDSITGNVTLKLDNIPWDQALDFILKAKGLGKRASGNILLIAPNEEIAAREQLELETRKQSETLAPLQSEFFQINYAKATDIEKMLKSEGNSVLSERGVVSVDERTNTLLIKDTADKLADIRKVIEKLDVPIKQVLIEAQVVQTQDNFLNTFGINFGGASKASAGKYKVGIGGDLDAARRIANNNSITNSYQSDENILHDNKSFFNTSGTAKGLPGKVGLAIARLPGGTLLDLELRASELEDKSKVLARPKLMTLNKQTASIEHGTEIPYQTTSQAGTSTTFKKAVLGLSVTPQITPNNKILLELTVSQDQPSGTDYTGGPGISTINLKTNILIDNGETVVLGGIFKIDHQRKINKVPFFSSIPLIGRLFRDHYEKNDRNEVLIFVTPKIIKANTMN